MQEKLPKVKRSFYVFFVKRALDVILSGFAILLFSPLFVIISFLELLFHGWPILYTQERPGLHGEPFRIYKFRSMTNKKDKHGRLLPSEKRLTRFGRFLRRYSLDELPELFCIFKGDMSIVGPRPLLPEYMPLYSKRHRRRHALRPGLTCVPLKPVKTWTWNDQFENDIWYIEHCSFLVDLRMVVAIIRETIDGADYRVDDTREAFNGKNLYSNAKEKSK